MRFHNLVLLIGIIAGLVISIVVGVLLHYLTDLEFMYIPIISAGVFIFMLFLSIGLRKYHKDKPIRNYYMKKEHMEYEEDGSNPGEYDVEKGEQFEYFKNKYFDLINSEQRENVYDVYTDVMRIYNSLKESENNVLKGIDGSLKKYGNYIGLKDEDEIKINKYVEKMKELMENSSSEKFINMLTTPTERRITVNKNILENEFKDEQVEINRIIINKLNEKNVDMKKLKEVLLDNKNIPDGSGFTVGTLRGASEGEDIDFDDLIQLNQAPDIISKIGYYFKKKREEL